MSHTPDCGERNLDHLVRSVLGILAKTDLPPLPENESETLDLAMRHVIPYLAAKNRRLQEAIVATLEGERPRLERMKEAYGLCDFCGEGTSTPPRRPSAPPGAQASITIRFVSRDLFLAYANGDEAIYEAGNTPSRAIQNLRDREPSVATVPESSVEVKPISLGELVMIVQPFAESTRHPSAVKDEPKGDDRV